MNLPLTNTDGSVIGQDSTMMILFLLALKRGNLPRPRVHVEMHEIALKGWDIMDQCQVIPIGMLEQFPSPHGTETQPTDGFFFPLSSSSAVRFLVTGLFCCDHLRLFDA